MIIFSLPDYKYLEKSLLKERKWKRGQFNIERYANQELLVEIKTKVKGEACVVLGGTAPPDSEILKLTLLAHTLKINGAKKIIALIPYLGYARQAKKEDGKSLAVSWQGELLKSSGISKVITIDAHSVNDSKLFPIPIISLTSSKLFSEALKKYPLKNMTLVAPDHGAIQKAMAIKKTLKIKGGIAFFDKKRTEKGIQMSGIKGKIKNRAIVVDDMLDTGGTLVACIEKLHERGVKEIIVVFTHGLFTGSKWKKLWYLGVKKIYCLDSVPYARDLASSKITVLPSAKIISQYFKYFK